MLCDEDQGRMTGAFLEKFNIKTFQKRIPLVGTIELTSRCNLHCVHCYVSIDTKKTKRDAELPARQWIDWIDQFAESGCLYLLFTGGETLLRSDFPEIYAHACQKGILVTVFTNGTLLSERVIQVFETYPPHCVEITLYGATAATYEKITGVPGSFEKCIKAISRLIKGGFHLKLKTMLLALNSHELEDMKAFAADLGVSFRYDAAVFPRLDADQSPLQYRVSPELAVQKDSLDRKHVKHWRDLYQRLKNLPATDTLYACGAGVNIFHVDSTGILRPCFMVPGEKFDLKQYHFYDIWNEKEFIDFRKPGEMPTLCQGCDKISLCGYCPGFFYLETGDERIPSTFLCEIGERRRNMIFNFISEEKNNAKQ
jgi:radical SAM protein with 4Fe4S-binding SPASM domain